MTTNIDPSAPPKTVQRIRVRRCGLKLRMLSDDGVSVTTFVCQEEKGHEGSCAELGTSFRDNGTAQKYCVEWDDLGMHAARLMKEKM